MTEVWTSGADCSSEFRALASLVVSCAFCGEGTGAERCISDSSALLPPNKRDHHQPDVAYNAEVMSPARPMISLVFSEVIHVCHVNASSMCPGSPKTKSARLMIKPVPPIAFLGSCICSYYRHYRQCVYKNWFDDRDRLVNSLFDSVVDRHRIWLPSPSPFP